MSLLILLVVFIFILLNSLSVCTWQQTPAVVRQLLDDKLSAVQHQVLCSTMILVTGQGFCGHQLQQPLLLELLAIWTSPCANLRTSYYPLSPLKSISHVDTEARCLKILWARIFPHLRIYMMGWGEIQKGNWDTAAGHMSSVDQGLCWDIGDMLGWSKAPGTGEISALWSLAHGRILYATIY
jgi:hypothetical protein